jgi:hypothetical protein
MNNNFWGPPFWMMTHTSAGNATTPIKVETFIDFADKKLQHMLGCDLCSEHYIENKNEMNIFKHLEYWTSEDRGYDKMLPNEALLYWTYLIHERVNHRLNKPSFDWEACKKLYLPKKANCHLVCGEEDEEECHYVTKIMQICKGKQTEVINSSVITGKKTIPSLLRNEESLKPKEEMLKSKTTPILLKNEETLKLKQPSITVKNINSSNITYRNTIPNSILGKSSRVTLNSNFNM